MSSHTRDVVPKRAGPPPIAARHCGEGAKRRVLLAFSLAGALALLALVLFAIAPLAPAPVPREVIDRELSLIEWGDFRPEPRERFLYIWGVLLLPFSLLGVYLAARRLLATPFGVRLPGLLGPAAAWTVAVFAPAITLAAVYAEKATQMKPYLPAGAAGVVVGLALALVLAFARDRGGGTAGRMLTLTTGGLAGLLLLGVLLFTVTGPEHIRNIPIYHASFNAVYYSVVQVCLGRALLVDFVNQYGLYPHFLEPVLRLVGIGVYPFTVVMGLLSCLAYACFYRFVARETGDRVLAFLALATLVFFGFFAGRVVSRDLYLQYQPLRILFPAFTVLLARSFSHRPSPALAAALAALGAAALLWNTDTGVVLLATALLVPAYDALLRRRPREVPVRLLQGAVAALAVVGTFSCSMRLRYGAFPDWLRMFAWSKAFYLYGVNMLPMPPFGLWVPVVLVYAVALLLAVAALVEGTATPRARLYFFLAVLGLGVFTYYQGRSVLDGLMLACYPAVLLLALFVDDLRRGLAQRPGAADRLLAGSLLFVLALAVPSLAVVARPWYRIVEEKVRATRRGQTEVPLRDAQFLQRHFRPGDKVLIMSYNSGLYHALTGTTNPIDIPGDSELIYARDFEKQKDFMATLQGPAVFDKSTMVAQYVRLFLSKFPASVKNPDGNLVILRKGP